jgi:hypothetical protein
MKHMSTDIYMTGLYIFIYSAGVECQFGDIEQFKSFLV